MYPTFCKLGAWPLIAPWKFSSNICKCCCFFFSHQIQSEPSDFHFDASYKLELLTVLGTFYLQMEKYNEARKVMEEALMVCLELGEDKASTCASINGELGWIYK